MMNFVDFSDKVQEAILGKKHTRFIKVQVLDVARTQLNGGPVAVNVSGVEFDQNNGILYIEITDNIAE